MHIYIYMHICDMSDVCTNIFWGVCVCLYICVFFRAAFCGGGAVVVVVVVNYHLHYTNQ